MRARMKNMNGEDGFTLLELLAVILIIGLLAAIALPSFLNQRTKATDAGAEELAHTAQIAAEDYATDNNGSYAGLTVAKLSSYDGTIQTSSGNGNAYLASVTNATATGYTVTTESANGDESFSITRTNGVTTRTCTPTGVTQGTCTNGSW